MSQFRPLVTFDFRPKLQPSRTTGKRPEFRWISVELLVVDDTYQRPITGRGRGNIVHIVESFDWRKFKPCVVVPTGDGRFAIIDGQHRATAALMHPLCTEVPCMVIEATPEEAAECFADINGRVTSMTLGQMFHARVAAGELWAREVKAACDEVGAIILKAKNSAEGYRPGETLAVGTIERCARDYGSDILRIAMRAILSGGASNAGLLNAVAIRAMCGILKASSRLRNAGDNLHDAMRHVGFRKMHDEAKAASVADRKPAHIILASRLAVALGAVLDAKARKPAAEKVPA